MVQVHVGATPWRVESSQPHSEPVASLRRGRSLPLSSRGLGRRPLTAETGVRIPVAVLHDARPPGGFRRSGWHNNAPSKGTETQADGVRKRSRLRCASAACAMGHPVGMAKALYTAEATVTGGRAQGHGVTSDGVLDVQLRAPKETGGEGDGTNPEQLFAVGYAACFEGAIGAIGRRERVEVGDVSIESSVSLIAGENRTYTIGVELDVTLPHIEDAELAER